MFFIADHKSLIDALGGNSVVAKGCGVSAVRVGAWKRANRIPAENWPDIIKLAADKQYDQINPDWLMTHYAPRSWGNMSVAESCAK